MAACLKARRVLAVRHVSFEGLDGFVPALEALGFSLRYVDVCAGGIPGDDLAAADLLIIMGGPIGAYEDRAYPFLKDELAAIERRLAAGKPILGICLGAQLIARAMGARVYSSGTREIGFAPIQLTDAGARSCLAPFKDKPMTLHWHGDTFDLPDGAVRLASSAGCENQAFAAGTRIIGFQCHPEFTGWNIEHWLVGHAAELAAAQIDVVRLRADAGNLAAELARKAHQVAADWLESIDAEQSP